MTSLFVATPMYGGMCSGPYAQSMLELERHLAGRCQLQTSFMFNESLITRARNALAHGFLKSDCTHLFFIDSDIRFHAEDVLPMVEAGKDVICGIYPRKEIHWPGVANALGKGVPVDQLRWHTGAFVVNLAGAAGRVTVRVDQPVEILNGGTGFMLIRREVFERLKPLVPTYVNDVADLGGTLRNEVIHEFFATSIDPETRRLLSEDYHFCALWRRAGGQVWAAPWARLAHVGTYVFDGRLVQTPAPGAPRTP